MSDVLVVMERGATGFHRMSYEALAAGQMLAAQTGGSCAAAVLGADVKNSAAELATKKLAAAWSVQHELLAEYHRRCMGKCVAAVDCGSKAEVRRVRAYVPGPRLRGEVGNSVGRSIDWRCHGDPYRRWQIGIHAPVDAGQVERGLCARLSERRRRRHLLRERAGRQPFAQMPSSRAVAR